MSWNPELIETVYPIAALKEKESGRTLPIEMLCKGKKGSLNYIVKLWNNNELKEHSLARETYASLLANYFKLKTPPIAFVDIPADFALSLPNPAIRDRVRASLGLNFGSLYIPQALQFSPPPSPQHIPLATRIFCFDMLIGNFDRRQAKINMFKDKEGFIIYDHEQAFPYSLPHLLLGGMPSLTDFLHESWCRSHILYTSLKGKSVMHEIEEFSIDIERLKDNILSKIESSIPDEWKGNIQNISNYLATTRDNAKVFKRCLQELLA